MSTDRELLELAAKAAQLPECGWMGPAFMYAKDNALTEWNPLADDGDEARLEAELGMDVVWLIDKVCVWDCFEDYAAHDGDKQAARRLAGVRAAAEIGRGMLTLKEPITKPITEPVNVRLLEALKRAKDSLVAFKFTPGDANRWEESDEENLAAVNSAIARADAQQERLLQDMHDAGLEIDGVMAEPAPEAVRLTDYSSTVDRAWARFCGAFGDGPNAPYPGMIASFEIHYGQSFRDKEWRTEAACWAAAWSKATARADAMLASRGEEK